MLHVFIINSFAGKGGFSEYIRNELEIKKNIEFLIFNSEYPGHEGALAAQLYELFSDDFIRFYACGGSGTFRNIINSLPDLERAEFAEIPYGQKDAFRGVRGEERRKFLDLDAMINGTAVCCDYIDTNIGRAHKSISSGLEVVFSNIQKRLVDNTFINGALSGFIAGIGAVFGGGSFKARYVIDGEEISGNYAQFAAYNGDGVSGMPGQGADGEDNKLEIMLVPKKNIFLRLYIFLGVRFNKRKVIQKYCHTAHAGEIEIYPEDSDTLFGFDGEIDRTEYIKAKIVHNGLRYIIPFGFKTEGSSDGQQ